MSILRIATATAFASVLILPLPASAVSFDPGLSLDAPIEHVAQGCGPGGWRGPWGGCRYHRGWGWRGGCGPGAWRGPWGHCRNTPYHGRLPGGGWQ